MSRVVEELVYIIENTDIPDLYHTLILYYNDRLKGMFFHGGTSEITLWCNTYQLGLIMESPIPGIKNSIVLYSNVEQTSIIKWNGVTVTCNIHGTSIL